MCPFLQYEKSGEPPASAHSLLPSLSLAGPRLGVLLPSAGPPGLLPATHQSPMGDWCKTQQNPEKRGGGREMMEVGGDGALEDH